MGFCSTGLDGNVYFYDLISLKETGTNANPRILDKDFYKKGLLFTSAVTIPGKFCEVYVVGNDKKIWHSKDSANGHDTGSILSQIVMTANQKFLFGGVGEQNKPGAIQIYKLPLDKINEV